MRKLGIVSMIVLFFGLGLAGQEPTVELITLTPDLDISKFAPYTLSATVNPNGTTINNVTFLVRPQSVGINTLTWDYLTNGTPIPDPNVPLSLVATGPVTDVYTYNGLRPDDIYPEIQFIPEITSPPSDLRFFRGNYNLMNFKNPFPIGGNTSFFIEIYASPSTHASVPDLQVYLVGKDFDISDFQTGGVFANQAWMNHTEVESVGTINRSTEYHHTHTANSKHFLVPLSTNADGTIGSKGINISGDFWIILYNSASQPARGWDLKYHEGDNNSTWYMGGGTNFSVQPGLPDVHVHFARRPAGTPDIEDIMEVKVQVDYSYNDITDSYTTNTATPFSFGELPNLPPNASSFIAPAAGTYAGDVTISWNPATDPNNDLLSYSIYLYDNEQEVDLFTIAENITSTFSYDFDTNLTSDRGYNIRIKVCDPLNECVSFFRYDTYLQGEEFVIANNPKTWTGASSAEWDDSNNWNPSGVPSGAEVLIFPDVTNDLIINSSKDAKRITIKPGGKVTIGPEGALTLYEALVNEAGATGLVIGYGGSLIHKAAWPELGVPATVSRTIPSGNWVTKNTKDGWHLLSSPMQNQLIESGFTATQAIEYDFYGWDEATDTWVNQKGSNWNTWNGEAFIPGRGYLVSYKNGLNGEFLGNLNLEDVAVSGLTFSGNPTSDFYEKGWHLLGSPYASGLDWGSTSWVKTNIGSTAKIWGEGGYIDVQEGLNNTIPAMQGFFVQVTEASGSITIPVAARTHGGVWNKIHETPHILLTASAEGSSLRQRAVIREHPSIEGDFNAAFLPGNAPQFFAVAENRKLSTWAHDKITPDLTIDLGFIKNNEGKYFDISLMQGIPGIKLWLYDKQLDYEHALDVNKPYSFVSEAGDDAMRFEIRFKSINETTGIDAPEQFENTRIFATNNVLHVQFSESQSSRFEIYDLSGRMLLQQAMGDAQQYDQPLSLQTGVYLVRVTGKHFTRTEKIIIQ